MPFRLPVFTRNNGNNRAQTSNTAVAAEQGIAANERVGAQGGRIRRLFNRIDFPATLMGAGATFVGTGLIVAGATSWSGAGLIAGASLAAGGALLLGIGALWKGIRCYRQRHSTPERQLSTPESRQSRRASQSSVQSGQSLRNFASPSTISQPESVSIPDRQTTFRQSKRITAPFQATEHEGVHNPAFEDDENTVTGQKAKPAPKAEKKQLAFAQAEAEGSKNNADAKAQSSRVIFPKQESASSESSLSSSFSEKLKALDTAAVSVPAITTPDVLSAAEAQTPAAVTSVVTPAMPEGTASATASSTPVTGRRRAFSVDSTSSFDAASNGLTMAFYYVEQAMQEPPS